MKKALIYFLGFVFSGFSFSVFSQQDQSSVFFSSVPSLLTEYPDPGNPCTDAVEFIVNSNAKSTVELKETGITKDTKGKTKVNVTETGNKSIWYKITFESDCELNFRIYADRADDIYHFFVYRKSEDPDFCKKLSARTIVPIRANMLEHKEGTIGTGIADGIKINYRDTTALYFKRTLFHTPFLDGIKGKAGETYFINIYHMGGTDAFHYLVLSACYREVNLKTQNDNFGGEKAEIIDKLPEHVTHPPAEKTQAEKDSLAALEKANEARKKAEAEAKKKTEQDAAEKAKADAAAKKIAEAKAKQLAAEQAKKKSSVKKIVPQLVSFDEPDTLNQYIIEGEIVFASEGGPIAQTEVYLFNSDGPIVIAKKMYSTEKGLFRFPNLPENHRYNLALNGIDPALAGKEPKMNGKLTLKGQPAAGVLINETVKTAEDGSFTLTGKELFAVNVNELFERWSIDLSDPAVYAEVLKKYGGISVEGLVYRVQIGAYREKDNFDYSFMTDLGKVDRQSSSDGITRFVIGEFTTLRDADSFKQKVFEKEINDAFIIAYFNGNKKYLEELIEKNMLDKQ